MKKVILISLFVIMQLPVQASENDDIKNLIMSLNSHIVNLEKRVKELENLVKIKTVNISNSKVTWRKLTKGLSFSQVRNILGEPLDIDVSTNSTSWYYTKGRSASKLWFYQGSLSSWTEPKS